MLKLKKDILVYPIMMLIFLSLSLRLIEGMSVLIDKFFLAFSLLILGFSSVKKINYERGLIFFIIIIIFLIPAVIHYMNYGELGHILTPILFFLLFFLGIFYPYKNSFWLLIITFTLTLYICYVYISQFQLRFTYNRFNAEGFDINYLGFVFNFYSLLITMYIKEHKKNVVAYLLLGTTILLGFLTSSRGTLLAFFFTLVLFLYKERLTIKLVFLGLFSLFVVVIATQFYELIEAVIDRFLNPSHRNEILKKAIAFYDNLPYIDKLFGTKSNEFTKVLGFVTHNDFLRILVYYGVVNLVLYCAMYFLIIIKIINYSSRERIAEKDKVFCMFVLMMIFMFFFRGSFSNFFPLPYIYYFIGSFYGKFIVNNNEGSRS